MTNNLGMTLNPMEEMPIDPYLEARNRSRRQEHAVGKTEKPLKKFLQNDRKVLRFYAVWDDRENMHGEVRDFVGFFDGMSLVP